MAELRPTSDQPPPTRTHLPVLLRETVELLAPQVGDCVVDCTAGLGGHAAAMAALVAPTGRVVLFDLDPANLAAASECVRGVGVAATSHHASFAEAASRLRADGVVASVLLADLGFASPQVDDPERGFSFMRDGPLDMRLNPQSPISAGEMVNTMGEKELGEIIRDLGEEPPGIARRIAAKVVQERKAGPILTTVRLAEIVRAAIPAAVAAEMRIHPATRTFQALRIAVNDEIGSLERLLDSIGRAAAAVASGKESWLAPGARVGIISFHSLEDRPVKQRFADLAERGLVEPVTRKPVTASDEEVAKNPRSRSAKLRVIRLAGSARQ